MTDNDPPPEDFSEFATALHPDDQAIVDLAHAVKNEVVALLTRHGVQDFQVGDVLKHLSDVYYWVGESDPAGDD